MVESNFDAIALTTEGIEIYFFVPLWLIAFSAPYNWHNISSEQTT